MRRAVQGVACSAGRGVQCWARRAVQGVACSAGRLGQRLSIIYAKLSHQPAWPRPTFVGGGVNEGVDVLRRWRESGRELL